MIQCSCAYCTEEILLHNAKAKCQIQYLGNYIIIRNNTIIACDFAYTFYAIPIQYVKFVHLITLLWAIALAIYWLISGALLAHLYDKFCDERNDACDGTIQKFILLPVMGFFCMGAWVGLQYIRICTVNS